MLREQQRQQQQMLKQAEQQRRAAEKAMIASQREAERALKAQQAEAARQQREAERAQAAAQREAERAARAAALDAQRQMKAAEKAQQQAQREAEKAQLAAQREAEKAQQQAQREAEKAQQQALREAQKAQLAAQRDAEKAQAQAQREAEKAQALAQKEAERQAREATKTQQAAQRDAEKAQLAAQKEAERQARREQVKSPVPVAAAPVVTPTVQDTPVIIDRRAGERDIGKPGGGFVDRTDNGRDVRQPEAVVKANPPAPTVTDRTVSVPVVGGQVGGDRGDENRGIAAGESGNRNEAAIVDGNGTSSKAASGKPASGPVVEDKTEDDKTANSPKPPVKPQVQGVERAAEKPPVTPSVPAGTQPSAASAKSAAQAVAKPVPEKTTSKDPSTDKSKDKAQGNSKSAKGDDDTASKGPDWLPAEARVRKAERQMLVPGLSKDERGRLEKLGFRVIETPAQSPAKPSASPPSGAAGGSSSGGASSGQTSQPSAQAPSAARLVRVEAPQSMSREDAAAILAQHMPLTPIAVNHGYTIYTGSQGKQASEPARPSPISACGKQDCATPGLVDWSHDLDACTAKVKVGIIDTSFDLTHPALRGIDYETEEFLDGEKPSPFDWHGTAVLSLLGGDSKSGTPGLIPNAKYYLATAFRSDPNGNASTDSVRLVAALEWLERSGVNFINMSFSGPRDKIFEDTVRRMRRKGVVFVAAAGNQGPTAPPSYPGAYPDVIAVTAINRQGESYKFANRGGYIDVSAPGVDVMAALPGAKQGLRTGTSFAAPFVTAIMVAHTGGLAKTGAKRDLLVGLETQDLGPPGDDPIYGRGFAVAPKVCGGRAPAVAASKPPPSDPPAAAPVSAGLGREEETVPAFSFAPANVFSFGGASAQPQPPSGGGAAGNAGEALPGSMSIGTGFAPNK